MKKIILNLILAGCFLPALVYISCERKNDIPNQEIEELTVPVNTNGIAHFATAKDFFETIDKASAMTRDERKKLESEMGFVSQFSLINAVMREIEEADTEEEINAILEKNKDLIKMSEENEITTVLPTSAYSFVINRAGYYYVNNYLHKVTPEGVLISKIPGVTEINEVNDEVIMDKTSSNETKAACGTELSGQVTEGNRRAKVYIVVKKISTDDGTTWYYRDYVTWSVKGFRKVLGAWYSYNSILYYQNVRFTVNTMLYSWDGTPRYGLMSYNFPGPGESPVEDWEWSWTVAVGDYFESIGQTTLQQPSFNKVYAEGKSRGTTGWAVIDCGN